MDNPKGPLSILHVVLSIGETNAAYNEHCLPWAENRDITVCTYFASNFRPAERITMFEGDGSLTGFLRVFKTAVNRNTYDVIHAHSPHVGLFCIMAMMLNFRHLAATTVMTVHDSYSNFKLRNRAMLLPVFMGFRRIVCCSRASFDSFPVVYKWLAGDRLCFVQNGLDVGRVDRVSTKIQDKCSRTNNFTLIAISRLVEIKNPFSALHAFAHSTDPSSRLVYIGDGKLRQPMETQSRESGADKRIELTGLIPRDKVLEHLLNADLFISTSRGEGLPISVLEAMSCCCPVVLSDIPPHREIAEGEDFIPLVHPDDTRGFSREISRFQRMSSSERKEIGQRCRRLVQKRFSLQAMHLGYNEVYAELAHKPLASLAEFG